MPQEITKNQIISALLGDDVSPFIASDLKDSYTELIEHISNINEALPIYSNNTEEELEQCLELLKAFRLVHNWYSTTPIEEN